MAASASIFIPRSFISRCSAIPRSQHFVFLHYADAYRGVACRVTSINLARDFKLEVDQNHAPAQFNYAVCLANGRGVGVDLIQSAKYYKLAADQNHAEAQIDYAFCLGTGRGVGVDLIQSAIYLKLAADQDVAEAQFNYAFCLGTGRGVGVDLIQSAKYLKLAADQDYAEAQFNYAVCLGAGRGVGADSIQSTQYLKLAADQNHALAQFNYAFCLGKGKGRAVDVPESLKYFRRVAADHHRGMDIHAESRAGRIDRRLAEALYSRAVSLRHDRSLNRLGKRLEFGRHAARDIDFAAECYSSAASHGDSNGMVNFGFCLEHGLGVERDLFESGKLFEQSGHQQNSGGAAHCALSLHFGIGFDEDLDTAADHYRFASEAKSAVLTRHSFRCLRGLNMAPVWKVRARPAVTEVLPELEKPNSDVRVSARAASCRVSQLAAAAGTCLGCGTYAYVTLEIDPKKHRAIAVKHLSKDTDRARLMREVEHLAKLRHLRIIRILGWSDGTGSSGGQIRMELARNGTLRSFLDSVRRGQLSHVSTATRKAIVICDIVLGMRYVHGEQIIHRDLKPSNILMDENWHAKIGDFGVSRPESADGPVTADTGTVGYAAPEQLCENGIHTTKTDVFSFGLILYEIISGKRVFGQGETPMGFLRRLRDRDFPTVPETFGSLMQSLIVRCWAGDQGLRPSFAEILKEIEGVDYEILPGVDAELVKKSVNHVLEWESEQGIRL
jgi:TPR repeat protein/tRNA A-37 threonylcarbamoyl transferase component Bud32